MVKAMLIATTVLFRERLEFTPYSQHPLYGDETVLSADELTELAARSRFGSWDRFNISRNDDYLSYLLELGETGFWQHASATFWVADATPAFAVELLDFAPFLRISASAMRPVELAPWPMTFVISGDMEAWRTAVDMSMSVGASDELTDFGQQALRQLRTVAPNAMSGVTGVKKERPVKPMPDEPFLSAVQSECG